METVQAFMQHVTDSSSASSQQTSALSQAIPDFCRIMRDTQTKTLSGIERALESYSNRAGAAELHQLVKAPEVFAPSTWDEERKTFPDFHRKFKTWLSAIEPRFGEHIDSIEKDSGSPLITAEMTPRTEALGKKLYAVLTSYTKGRPLRTISKVPGQNGFEAYRLLVHEKMPKSQVCNFHFLQNIINFKSDSGRSLNENVLAFEQSVEDYEKISDVLVGSETKLAVMIATGPADVQEHILLNYDDKKSYEDIRDYMLNIEKNKRWKKLTTKEKRQTTTDLIESGQDHGGQADMDINQVKGKGKSKSFKGKGKGKGKSDWESGYGKGRGYKGRGRGFKGRGKGRGFGRGFGKGGGKYNQKGSRRKGLCNYCQKPGHYEAECRLKQRDVRTRRTRQVQEDQQSSVGVSQAPTTAPSTTTATTQQTRATKDTRLNVRQIDVWHIGDEPDQFPESFVFSGSEEEEVEIDYSGRILAVRISAVEHHCMCSEDEEDAISLDMSDSLLLWWYDFNDSLHVRAVSSSHPVSGKAIQIVLDSDSGADVSLLPRNMRYAGQSFRSALSNMRTSDAQGSRNRVDDERVVTLEFTGHNGVPVQITEKFLVADVTSPLLAIGKLIRSGWGIIHHAGDGDVPGPFL